MSCARETDWIPYFRITLKGIAHDQPSGGARPLGQSPELCERTSLICTYFELGVIRIAMEMYDKNVNNITRRMGKIEWFFSSFIRLLLFHWMQSDALCILKRRTSANEWHKFNQRARNSTEASEKRITPFSELFLTAECDNEWKA